ncbi:MAG: peptidoglycan DD-metalloendopeptidase family protein [Bacteroidaceae bacterium]
MIEYNKHKNKLYLLLIILFMCLHTSAIWGQSNATINKLKNERNTLQEQISQSASLLKSTEKTVGQELNELLNIEAQINEQNKFIKKINENQVALEKEVNTLTRKIEDLTSQLKECKDKYASSLRYVREQHSIQQRMIFIFSADSFNQMIRRLRYMMEYANYQKSQAQEIQLKQAELFKRQTELEEAKKEMGELIKSHTIEQKKLEASHEKQDQLIKRLNKKKSVIKEQISVQQRKANVLNEEIDKQIKLEIQRAEAVRKERERKAKADIAKRNPEATSSKSTTKSQPKNDETIYSKTNRQEIEEINKLSGSFVSNKGKMPYPITGEHVILQHFGTYAVNGLQFITLDNKGLIIKGEQGAKARSVFDGEVTAIFPLNGLLNIIIKHGEYRTIYCNLKTVNINAGDNVKIGQTLGEIYIDPVRDNKAILHFEIRKGTTLINPESWIR